MHVAAFEAIKVKACFLDQRSDRAVEMAATSVAI